MPNLDTTVILLTAMAITDMDMVFLDVALLISEVTSWERGQLRLMPNPDITVMEDLTVTTMDLMAILMDLTDTVLMDLVTPDTLLVLLSPTEVSKVPASKSAISN